MTVQLTDFRPLLEAAGLPGHVYLDDIVMPLDPYILSRLRTARIYRVAQLLDGGPDAAAKVLTTEEYNRLCELLRRWAEDDWRILGNAALPPDLSHARIQPYLEQKRRGRKPRSLCPFCGGNPVMIQGDRVRSHKDLRKRYPYGGSPDCPGSGEKSAGLPSGGESRRPEDGETNR